MLLTSFITSTTGNSCVVAVVVRSPRMRTVTNYFIVNLALADILVLVFCLPATLLANLFIRKHLLSLSHESFFSLLCFCTSHCSLSLGLFLLPTRAMHLWRPSIVTSNKKRERERGTFFAHYSRHTPFLCFFLSLSLPH